MKFTFQLQDDPWCPVRIEHLFPELRDSGFRKESSMKPVKMHLMSVVMRWLPLLRLETNFKQQLLAPSGTIRAT